MVTRVYLVRHGSTVLSAEDRFAGRVDVELSEEGRAQAAALSGRLAGEQIQAIYASPLSRTVATARLIAGEWGGAPVLRNELREIDHGRWEGLTRREVESRFAAEYAAWEEDPFTFAPSGGESGVAVLARALPAFRDILTRHAGEKILVVSHKATIRLLLSSLLGFDPRGYRDRMDQAPACLNILDFRDPVRARLMLFNDTSHYAGYPAPTSTHLSKWWDAPVP